MEIDSKEDAIKLAELLGFNIDYNTMEWIRFRHKDAPKHNPSFAVIYYDTYNTIETFELFAKALQNVGIFKVKQELQKLLII